MHHSGAHHHCRYNYTVVVGDQEVADQTVSVRARGTSKAMAPIKVEAFVQMLQEEVATKRV
jgi:threonyl-tRNA synthetase